MHDRDRAQLELFLRDCRDQPDDDTSRLVLGDWLQDLGDPRGELIHLQVRRTSPGIDPQERAELQRREMQLLTAHALAWLGPLVDYVASWVFNRGMLSLEARAERILREEVLAQANGDMFLWVEGLHLTETRMDHAERLAKSSLLGRLTTLDLGDNRLGDAGTMRLLDGPGLASLRSLYLTRNRIGNLGTVSLARCTALNSLHRLDLSRNRIGDAGALALAESPCLDGLRRLNLGNNNLSRDSVSALRGRFGDAVRIARSA